MSPRWLRLVQRALSLEWFPTGNVARWLSTALGLAGAGLSVLLFFGIVKSALSLDVVIALGPKSVFTGVAAALAANGSLFLAWKSLANPLSVGLAFSFSLYSKSALARYIPTGVGHLLVRQLSAERWGLEKRKLLKVSMYEIAVAVSVAATLAVPVLLDGTGETYLLLIAALLLSTAVGSSLMSESSRSLLLSALWFGVYFLFSAIAIDFFSGGSEGFVDLARILVAYAAAWLISTLVPFFPGGVGLREITFIGIVSVDSVGEGYGAAAVLLRVSLWLAELLFAAVSLLLSPPSTST